MDNNFKVSSSQISKMRHAIGIDHSRVHNGVYEAYRNRYISEDDKDWNDLVANGYAKKRPFDVHCFVYSLTKEGLNLISNHVGATVLYDFD